MKRPMIAAALDRMGVPELVMAIRRGRSKSLTVLTYHRVGRPSLASALDDGVVDVDADQLDRQLAFLCAWFSPISVDDVLRYARADRTLPHNSLLVTFDDGYRDNYEVALPILLRRGVPATFFIATHYVENRRLFWWDRIATVLKSSPAARIELDYPKHVSLPLDQGRLPESIRAAQRVVKDCHDVDLDHFFDALERAAGVGLDSAEEQRLVDSTVMTWQHVVALRRAGMGVQSHTRTHRVLQTLSAERLDDELRGSRESLERVLSEPVRAVAYPVGKTIARAAHVRRAVVEAGYEIGFSNGTGVNRLRAFDPYDVRRVALDAAIDDGFFRASLAIPALGY